MCGMLNCGSSTRTMAEHFVPFQPNQASADAWNWGVRGRPNSALVYGKLADGGGEDLGRSNFVFRADASSGPLVLPALAFRVSSISARNRSARKFALTRRARVRHSTQSKSAALVGGKSLEHFFLEAPLGADRCHRAGELLIRAAA